MQVHDELVLEVKESLVDQIKDIVVNLMVSAGDILNAPLVVDTGIGDNWGEAH